MSKSTIDISVSYYVALEKLKVFPKEISTTLRKRIVLLHTYGTRRSHDDNCEASQERTREKVSKRHSFTQDSHKTLGETFKIRQTNRKKVR